MSHSDQIRYVMALLIRLAIGLLVLTPSFANGAEKRAFVLGIDAYDHLERLSTPTNA